MCGGRWQQQFLPRSINRPPTGTSAHCSYGFARPFWSDNFFRSGPNSKVFLPSASIRLLRGYVEHSKQRERFRNRPNGAGVETEDLGTTNANTSKITRISALAAGRYGSPTNKESSNEENQSVARNAHSCNPVGMRIVEDKTSGDSQRRIHPRSLFACRTRPWRSRVIRNECTCQYPQVQFVVAESGSDRTTS